MEEGEKPRKVLTKETCSGEGESEGGSSRQGNEVDAQICNQLVACGSADNPSEVCGGMVMVEHNFGADLDSDALVEERMSAEADDSCLSSADYFLG